MRLPFFLAWRLSFDSSGGRLNSRPAVRVAQIGVAVGILVMLLAVGITEGFKNEIREKISGFMLHMRVQGLRSSLSKDGVLWDEALDSVIRKGAPQTVRIQRYSEKTGVMKTEGAFQGILLKGVGQEYDLDFYRSYLVEGEIPAFTDSLVTSKAVISRSLADKMGLGLGDKADFYFMDDEVRIRRLEIAGLFQTHFSLFDDRYVLTDLRTVSRLGLKKDGRVDGLEIAIDDFSHLDEAGVSLGSALETYHPDGQTLLVQTVRDANTAMFAWLDILDMNILIILVLMILISGFTMVSGVWIILLERMPMIGTLKSMGARAALLFRTFLVFGGLMVLKGVFWGNVVFFLFSILQNRFRLLRLDAESYYMDHVPVDIGFSSWLLVNVLSVVLLLLFVLIPLGFIQRIRPSQTMRQD